MTPPPAARARATKSGSTLRKQNSEMAGTLERNISTAVPEGEMSSVETLSPSLMSTGARQALLGRKAARHRLDVRALQHLDAGRLGWRQRRDQPGLRGQERGRPVPLGRRARLARVADAPAERRDGGGQRRAQVDRVVLRAAPAREVAVEGAQAAAARGRHVADARAGAAGGLGDRGARREQGRRAAPRAPSPRGCDGCPGRPRRRPTARPCGPRARGSPPACPPTRSWCRSRP